MQQRLETAGEVSSVLPGGLSSSLCGAQPPRGNAPIGAFPISRSPDPPLSVIVAARSAVAAATTAAKPAASQPTPVEACRLRRPDSTLSWHQACTAGTAGTGE